MARKGGFLPRKGSRKGLGRGVPTRKGSRKGAKSRKGFLGACLPDKN